MCVLKTLLMYVRSRTKWVHTILAYPIYPPKIKKIKNKNKKD